MGFLRRKDERAMPKPGSKEFEEAVGGGPAEVGGQDGPKSADEAPVPEEEAPKEGDEHAAKAPRGQRVLGALGRTVMKPPNTEGFGGGIGAPKKRKSKD